MKITLSVASSNPEDEIGMEIRTMTKNREIDKTLLDIPKLVFIDTFTKV